MDRVNIYNQAPITREQQAAAARRLDPDNRPFVMVDLGGGPQKFYTGTVDLNDYISRDGYVVIAQWPGQPERDRYGWPKGHPDSPASPLPDPPEGT